IESAKRTALRTFRQEGGFCCRSTHPVSVRQVGLQVGLIAAARRYARRGDHAGLGTAEHRVGGAIAAIAEQRGHALLVGPEPAVGPAAVAAAVHGAPRIGGVGTGGLAGGRKACGAERQSNQDASHVEPLSMMGSASGQQHPAALWLHVSTCPRRHTRARAAVAAAGPCPAAARGTWHWLRKSRPFRTPWPCTAGRSRNRSCARRRHVSRRTGRTTDR